MTTQLPKTYDPASVEDRLYAFWTEKGYFHAEAGSGKPPFTIVIPPPNVTGQLHLGHAVDETLQDILIRMKRMQGFEALWMPGTDHAGIATQIKVEEMLRTERGLTRHDLGRDAFLELVWEWKHKYGGRIIEQLKKLGASCDWDRERFTMDEGCSKAVREVFVGLYEKGLIYKGSRIINWCPKCTTALSDAEVEYSEKDGNFWHIKYAVKDSDEFLVVATTRPETMLGDTAVAVSPEDGRYAHLVGKTLILPLVGREIPVVADEYVDREFGTGCVKITPSHDPNDFEVAARHDLPHVLIMDGEGKINENGGKYRGLDRFEARKAVVRDLEEQGLLVKVEPHRHNVGSCYRCSTVVEPLNSAQWFVKMKPLAEPAVEAVKSGEIKFVPDRFSKTYLNWMENVHDWCISRQLWWGHRIPAFYCGDCGYTTVSREDAKACQKCGSKNITQEEDVLDTWFSSALWPFSTLGWPDKTPELEYFYPTNVLVTGYEIIFFWVARMIFSGLEQLGKIPFDTVLIHGIMRDDKGRKMSKSLGNGIDPIEVIAEFGADALRLSIVTGNSPGNDMRFYRERCEAMRNFTNKIWNASRFVQMNLTITEPGLPEASRLAREDKWLISKHNSLVREVTENIERYEFGLAAQKVYEFIWDIYCDWYIEIVKPRLASGGSEDAQRVLCYVLSETLKLLHPFMPFITEEIWRALPHEGESIMVSAWPTYSGALAFEREEKDVEMVMRAIRAVRNVRAEMGVPPSKKAGITVVTAQGDVFRAMEPQLKKLAFAGEVTIVGSMPSEAASMVSAVTEDAAVLMPLAELVDTEKELARIEKELKKARADFDMLSGKLSNPGFLAKAPENVVAAEREKCEKLAALIKSLEESRERLA